MAQRRMIGLDIIDSARFLKMPLTSQALYMHLVCHADDDGIVEAFSVMRITGNSEDDLRILEAKRFIIVLNDDYVTYIIDWLMQNTLRADRKTDSQYQNLLLAVLPDVKLLQKTERSDRKNKSGTSHGQPLDGVIQTKLIQDNIIQQQSSCCSVDNLLFKLKESGLSENIAKKLLEEYESKKIITQLHNLKQAKNVKNIGAWLTAALKNDYQSTELFKPVPNPNCPICKGTGTVKYQVSTTNEIISRSCCCISTKN